MAGRTIAIGDIHGDLVHLIALWGRLPPLDAEDTLVFLGDYVDRGPDSAGVIRWIRTTLPILTQARIVCLRGNHEDAWLRVIDHAGWPEFTLPSGNGTEQCMRSFTRNVDDRAALHTGAFFPPDVVAWMRALPLWHEDGNAIYVHAGVQRRQGRWLHPSKVEPRAALLWSRSLEFFREYTGKRIVVGHTSTGLLPAELSEFTAEDTTDMWVRGRVCALDTGCGKGGFLSAVELPGKVVYESR